MKNKGEKMTNSKQDIVLAVSEYLAFSDENKELEAEIAEETAEKILETEKSNSKTINNLTFICLTTPDIEQHLSMLFIGDLVNDSDLAITIC